MAEQSNRQKDIFLKALDLPPAERASYLAQEYGSDDALRRQVEAMLQAHAAPDSFLEKPAAAMGVTVDAGISQPSATVLPDTFLGTRIGPYKLREQIGEGGMGVVYVAEQQEPVRRMVALKIIKPGMDSAQVLARFEAERQALALMDHPNIAKVLDAGTTAEGRPYFVMELVKGVPITQYCDERRLSLRQRLELFIPVCQAVQHAHQKAIIHRDLKPSNVLIALYDGKPVPKVIDFGVAKAMGEQLTEKSIYTGFGAVVGTLAYMSPEQAELNQIDIDTRSDIYSLGVMLYELLTGSTPIDRQRLKEGAILEVLRLIREEEPPRPSTRISTANTLVTLSEQRQTEPAQLAILLRGDIDWIVMKALDKDRARRYETAVELGQDIERFLKDEPVEASPPSAAYRLRKFVRRNRGAVIAASLVVFALLCGIGGTTAGLFEARWGRDEAIQARIDEGKERERAEKAEQVAKDRLAEVVDARNHLSFALQDAKKLANDEKAARLLAVKHEKEARFQALRFNTARHGIQMDLIRSYWEAGHIPDAYRELHKSPPEFRDTWEYRYIRQLCNRKALELAIDETFHATGYSPDGKLVATGDKNSLRLWDPDTGELRRRIETPGGVLNLTFSPDSKRIATFNGTVDGKPGSVVRVLDVTTAKELMAVPTYPSPTTGLAFNHDGTLLATLSDDLFGVMVLDVATGKPRYRIKEKNPFERLAFSPDGKLLLGAGRIVGVKLYDANTGQERRMIKKDLSGIDARYASFSPDSKVLFVSSYQVEVWNAETGKLLSTLASHPGDMGFTADSKSIVFVNSDGVKIFDWETGKNSPVVSHVGKTTCASMSPDGTRYVVGPYGVYVYAVAKSYGEKAVLDRGDSAGLSFEPLTKMGFTPDGKQIYAAVNNRVFYWNAETGKKERDVQLKFAPGNFFLRPQQLSWDGQAFVHYDFDNGLYRLVDVETSKEKFQLPAGSPRALTGAALSRDQLRAALGFNGGVKVWNTADRKQHLTFSVKGGAGHMEFSPDSKRLAISNFSFDKDDGAVEIWNVETKAKQLDLAFKSKGNVGQVSFFPDGKRLLIYCRDELSIWDATTGEQISAFPVGGSMARFLISPDGQRVFHGELFTAWDTTTGQRVFDLPGHQTRAISPDGRRILVTQGYSIARVVEIP